MLTPQEILDKSFRTGLGYDKKDVDQFLHDISTNYDALLKENIDQKSKIKEAHESLNYYKSIEKTLHKALILAEKTAQDTRATALREADAIELEAKAKASLILTSAKKEIEFLEHKTLNLMQQYNFFKIHFENLLRAQLELIGSNSFSINTENFTYSDSEQKSKELQELSQTQHNNSDQVNLESNSNKANQRNIEREFNQTNQGNIKDKLSNATQDNSVDTEAAILDQVNTEEIETAHFEPVDKDQIRFDFFKEQFEVKTYQTEDGFEFL